MRVALFVLAAATILSGFPAAQADEPVAPPAIKLAVFPFELEDFSAAAAVAPVDDVDREQLRQATEEARRLAAESGRYRLVDVAGANGEAAGVDKFRACGGCEAKIAAALGADQSMIGIVTRISRTEFAVTYSIRDARTAAVVDVEQTGLRMGANSAWSRGARWLIQHRLLGQP